MGEFACIGRVAQVQLRVIDVSSTCFNSLLVHVDGTENMEGDME